MANIFNSGWTPIFRPVSPFSGKLDKSIAPLIRSLNRSPHIATIASCTGHGKSAAYVFYAVHEMRRVKSVVRQWRRIQFEMKGVVSFNIEFDEDNLIAQDILSAELGWWPMTVRIHQKGRRGPTEGVLRKIGRLWEARIEK